MSSPLLDKNVCVDIGRMIDLDTCISFKMAIDDALYRRVDDIDTHKQIELGGESSFRLYFALSVSSKLKSHVKPINHILPKLSSFLVHRINS